MASAAAMKQAPARQNAPKKTNGQQPKTQAKRPAVSRPVGIAVMAVLLAIFAVPLIQLFSKVDPDMQQIGALCIRLQCLALPAHAWVAMVNMLCGGLGFAGWAIILATSRQGSCFLPIVWPLAAIFRGMGVASVQAVADMLTLIPGTVILRKALKRIDDAEREELRQRQAEGEPFAES